MKKQTKLQELNRQRGVIIYKFSGIKGQLSNLSYTRCMDLAYVVKIKAMIQLAHEAHDIVLADIDKQIADHKEFLYKSGARCNCGNRKLETSHKVEPTETITVYCSKCGNKWNANPEMKEQN